MLIRTGRQLACIMTLLQGLNTLKDRFLDAIFTTISQKKPMWGNTRDAERYQQADAAYEDLQASGKPVDRIVGHSLGGSVALQLQQDKGIPKSRTFGAPVVDLKPFGRFYGDAERYRHVFDPVSILDRGAKWGKVKLYPHSYTGYDEM